MRIIQMAPTLFQGDAVGNDIIAMHRILSRAGYETKIYAENIGSGIGTGIAESYHAVPNLNAEDLILYHCSASIAPFFSILRQAPCRKVMVYHNITPGEYFSEYDPFVGKNLHEGRKELLQGRELFDAVIAVSSYNREDLMSLGYTCPIAVLPILIPFDDYRLPAAAAVLGRYDDGRTNLLFVGRVAPNKKIENVIAAYAEYKNTYDANSRLFIVGNGDVVPVYTDRLRHYVQKLGLSLTEDVIFSGSVPFSHILAYYRLADVYICLSEHEGFCVPLVEAMLFDLPIVALSAAAMPETLGNAGLLLPSADRQLVAAAVHASVNDECLRTQLRGKIAQQLKKFSYATVRRDFLSLVEQMAMGNIPAFHPTSQEIYALSDKVERILSSVETREPTVIIDFAAIPFRITPTWKSQVKQKVLKPGYRWMHRFAPSLADGIGIAICRMMRRDAGRFRGEKLEVEKPPETLKRSSGLLVDVSIIAQYDAGTGIQRVVRNLCRNLLSAEPEAYAVHNEGESLKTAFAYMGGQERDASVCTEKLVSVQKGDILFLVDSSWDRASEFAYILREAAECGAKVFAVVYDLFPIQYPETAPSPLVSEIFIAWHDMVLQQADGIVCISRTTADNVAAYFRSKDFSRENPLQLFYFPMGAEIECKQGDVRREIMDFAGQKPTFLMVGTVEPRKGHQCVLQALASVAERHDIQLLVLGHDGWKNDEIKKDMENPAIKDRVLWVQDAADHELHWAYQNTAALIAASKDEGYGLPLIEAAYFGQPILCSDIPIFHEVTQEHATYFKVLDSASLADVWKRWLQEDTHPDSHEIRLYTWKESAQAILDILYGKAEPYKNLQ